MKIAVVVGATGLVGRMVVEELLAKRSHPKVICFVRKQTDGLPTGAEQVVVQLDDVAALEKAMPAGSWVFCCVGTTMAKAKSQEAFTKVDYDIPVSLAEAGRKAGISGMSLVSSVGASERGFFFYTRLKGEVEKALQAIPLPSLHIFRPGLLNGPRKESRIGEKVGLFFGFLLAPFMIGPFSGYAPIKARTVARAMVAYAMRSIPGVDILHNRDMRRLA